MTIHTGGCQCGAVRFRTEIDPAKASICHCRMCQKAFGNFYAPLVNARPQTLVWTKREPKHFQSSNKVRRGFCEDCGTPLTYEAPDGVALAIGAFDDPAAIQPVAQYGVEARLPYVDGLAGLPSTRTEEELEAAAFLRDLVSYQHPDGPDNDEAAPA